ncbi:MAG: SBBP repeat-containing protein [Acidobacteriota bacterium]|nr:SBBP repeat-containing protein [Acidobacteriota bacterium]
MIRTFLLVLVGWASAVQAAEYTTFIGGASPYAVVRGAADSAGNTYVAGNHDAGAFVMKLDPAGKTVFFRDISGQGPDAAADMGIDAAGNVYVGGATSSASFPVHNALQSAPGPGFVAKLSADGSQLVWSTYFREAVTALAVDAAGNVYVTGSTNDPQFPVTAGLPRGIVGSGIGSVSGAFLTKNRGCRRPHRLLRFIFRNG